MTTCLAPARTASATSWPSPVLLAPTGSFPAGPATSGSPMARADSTYATARAGLSGSRPSTQRATTSLPNGPLTRASLESRAPRRRPGNPHRRPTPAPRRSPSPRCSRQSHGVGRLGRAEGPAELVGRRQGGESRLHDASQPIAPPHIDVAGAAVAGVTRSDHAGPGPFETRLLQSPPRRAVGLLDPTTTWPTCGYRSHVPTTRSSITVGPRPTPTNASSPMK